MRSADVSQLPVLDDGKLVGIIDESRPAARASTADAERFREPVRQRHDRRKLETHRRPNAPLDALLPIFDRGPGGDRRSTATSSSA